MRSLGKERQLFPIRTSGSNPNDDRNGVVTEKKDL